MISGNRDLPYMQSQTKCFAGHDGRLTDLHTGLPATDMPLVSDNWTRHFTWQGIGPMPEAERQKLLDADVDHLNTDDLAGLEQFLRQRS